MYDNSRISAAVKLQKTLSFFLNEEESSVAQKPNAGTGKEQNEVS
jgi:hypothetical protein